VAPNHVNYFQSPNRNHHYSNFYVSQNHAQNLNDIRRERRIRSHQYSNFPVRKRLHGYSIAVFHRLTVHQTTMLNPTIGLYIISVSG
jgi:hypothetical protein